MYGAKPYQFEPTYTVIHRNKNQSKKKKKALQTTLHHNIRWHPNVPQCWDPDLLTIFFIMKHNMGKTHLKIDSPYFKINLEIVHF